MNYNTLVQLKSGKAKHCMAIQRQSKTSNCSAPGIQLLTTIEQAIIDIQDYLKAIVETKTTIKGLGYG